MKDAVIDTSVFKRHSTRVAATSAAKATNVSIHEIMNTDCDRPIINESNFSEAIFTSSS